MGTQETEVVVLMEGVHRDLGPIPGTPIVNAIDPICSSVTLVHGSEPILVDTGYRGYEEALLTRLQAEGVSPDEIGVVVNAHSHFDHCANNHLFPHARVILGRNVLSPRHWEVREVVEVPRITLLWTPGHYQDHQSVVVKTDQTNVIAGDAVREDILRDTARWQSVANDAYVESVQRIFAIADVIIPGHGPLIQGAVLQDLRDVLRARITS